MGVLKDNTVLRKRGLGCNVCLACSASGGYGGWGEGACQMWAVAKHWGLTPSAPLLQKVNAATDCWSRPKDEVIETTSADPKRHCLTCGEEVRLQVSGI